MIQILPKLKLLYHKLKRLLVKNLEKPNQLVLEVSQLLKLKPKLILSPTQSVHLLAALSIYILRQKAKTEDQNMQSPLLAPMKLCQMFKEPLLLLRRHTNTIGSLELQNQEP